MRFKFLEHTSDLEFEAYGKTLEEAFGNAALAFYHSIVDLSRIEVKEVRHVQLEAEDLESLLHDFLAELLYLFEVDGFLGKEVEVKIQDCKLSAVLKGEVLNAEKHETKALIKAITYHQLQVGKRNGTFFVHTILDI